MVVILMGVSGCGKTTIGRLLSGQLGWPFHDGDDYHPPENVEKMRQGTPLTDADREPWLRRLGGLIEQWIASEEHAILACSALSAHSRELLHVDRPEVRLVHLTGSKELIASRMTRRLHRYMPDSLLQSQFDALETPAGAINIDISGTPDQTAARVRQALGV